MSPEGASYLGGSKGRSIFKIRTLRNAVSSFSGTQESVSQARLEFTRILFKSKILNEIGQLIGKRGGGNGSKSMSCSSKKNYENGKNKNKKPKILANDRKIVSEKEIKQAEDF